MLLYLNGLESEKGAPNENYARELMELFTLGHGSGYTERDVREQARALTGFTAHYKNGYGWVKFRFDRNRHDDAMKVVFDKPGPYGWKQAVKLTIEHPAHKTFFTRKLWGYFIPEPADDETQAALEDALRPVRLLDEAGAGGDPQAPPPLRGTAHGEAAGRLPRRHAADARRPHLDRGLGLALDPGGPAALLPAERLGLERRPLARHLHVPRALATWPSASSRSTPTTPITRGAARCRPIPRSSSTVPSSFWGVRLSDATRRSLLTYAQKAMGAAVADDDRQRKFPPMTLNALRHLVAASPEMQTA